MAIKKRTWLSYFGAVLLVSAAPAVYGAQARTSTQSTAKKKTTAASKSKKNSKPKAQMTPTPDRIREIQSALQQKGAYQGEPTGKWDETTIEAMKNFQDKSGLTPSGKIDALTLDKLGLGSNTAGKGAPVPTSSTINPSPRTSP